MSLLKKAMGIAQIEEDSLAKCVLTEQQIEFIEAEGFSEHDYLDCDYCFTETMGEYTATVYLYLNGHMDLYIEEGEPNGEYKIEETFYFFEPETFNEEYKKMCSIIESFFRL